MSKLTLNTINLQSILETVNNLPEAGTDLPELTNPATAEEIFLNKETIDAEGNIRTGTFTIENELATQDDLIAQLQSAVDELPDASSFAPVLQDKTVTPTTSTQTITADDGYDGLSEVTVNAMPTATQATPSITVSSSGLVTASATQTAGYVSAGTKSATKQLTTQGAQTITPSTTNKTIASGRYLTGTQTIKGDTNLVSSNIKNGVSIFGVNGSYTGSGSSGGDIQTVTVTIDNAGLDGHVWYTDVSYNFIMQPLSGGFETIQIVCIKNTPVIFSGYGFSANIDSSYEIDYMSDLASESGMYLYHFTDNTTISIENAEAGVI